MVEKGGRDGSVVNFLPPAVISFERIDFALRLAEEAIIAQRVVVLQQDPASSEQTNQEWNKHFIQTGLGGSDEFAGRQTTQAMKAVFWTSWNPLFRVLDPKSARSRYQCCWPR